MRIRKKSVEASRNASLRRSLLEQLGEDRDERRAERGVGEQAAHEVRDLEGDRERGERAARGEVARRDDLADQTGDPAQAGGDREDRGVAGDARASRWVAGAAVLGLRARRVGSLDTAQMLRPRRPPRALRGRRAPPRYTPRRLMANIHSQKKRILRAERERLENRRYTSTIKTYFRRLRPRSPPATTRPPTPSTGRWCGRSTRPSSAARCTATPARARSPGPRKLRAGASAGAE